MAAGAQAGGLGAAARSAVPAGTRSPALPVTALPVNTWLLMQPGLRVAVGSRPCQSESANGCRDLPVRCRHWQDSESLPPPAPGPAYYPSQSNTPFQAPVSAPGGLSLSSEALAGPAPGIPHDSDAASGPKQGPPCPAPAHIVSGPLRTSGKPPGRWPGLGRLESLMQPEVQVTRTGTEPCTRQSESLF